MYTVHEMHECSLRQCYKYHCTEAHICDITPVTIRGVTVREELDSQGDEDMVRRGKQRT